MPCLSLLVLLCPYLSVSQLKYNVYISDSGRDSNSGISILTPKKTIAGATSLINKVGSLNGSAKIGLQNGSIFNESFTPSSTVQIGSYNSLSGGNDFTILNGSDVFDTGWKKVEGTINTYQQSIAHSEFSGSTVDINWHN
jgi:hypothetical protein